MFRLATEWRWWAAMAQLKYPHGFWNEPDLAKPSLHFNRRVYS